MVTIFTGMREGEVLGLQWDCVDLAKGTLTVNKQLQKVRGSRGEYALYPPPRMIRAAPLPSPISCSLPSAELTAGNWRTSFCTVLLGRIPVLCLLMSWGIT